ncbi:MAG: acyl carrier protein [Acidimicrobiales bacterium]
MTHDDPRALLQQLLRRIAPEIEIDTVDEHAPLREALDLDSMDFLNLVTALQEQTGIEVPERDYPEIDTVAGFIAYITAH